MHDEGVLSMYSSDSQAMGRIGEVVIRAWQTADKMKKMGGKIEEETGDNDNFRAKRYIAKTTINPCNNTWRLRIFRVIRGWQIR